MRMTKLEKIEDQYPELAFYGIEIPNKHYHGHIEGKTVYINLLQPDWDWVLTACHEIAHSQNDCYDCSDVKQFRSMKAEKWAVMESKRMYRALTK